MKRLLSTALLFAMALTLVSCGGGSATIENEISADAYITQLWEGLKENELPVNELDNGSTSEGTDADIGEYLYTGHIITDGVYVSTYETKDKSKLLRTQVMVDMNLARREKLSSGSFAIAHMIGYFDQKNADQVAEDLAINDISTSGISEAAGNKGTYKYMVNAGSNQIFLIYTITEE